MMKVKFFEGKDDNGASRVCIEVDGKEALRARCLSEYPEDAMLERDLNFVYGIPDLMKQAYDAGVRGESFEIERLPEVEW